MSFGAFSAWCYGGLRPVYCCVLWGDDDDVYWGVCVLPPCMDACRNLSKTWSLMVFGTFRK